MSCFRNLWALRSSDCICPVGLQSGCRHREGVSPCVAAGWGHGGDPGTTPHEAPFVAPKPTIPPLTECVRLPHPDGRTGGQPMQWGGVARVLQGGGEGLEFYIAVCWEGWTLISRGVPNQGTFHLQTTLFHRQP